MENFKYFVEQQYFDTGKTRTRILTAERAKELGYYNGYTKEEKTHDLYVDGFNSMKEVEDFCNDVANC